MRARYARRWSERVREAEAARARAATALTDAVARALFKLMAYKDEYEVARLYTDGRFPRARRRAVRGRLRAATSIWRRRSSPTAIREPAICRSATTGRGCCARSALLAKLRRLRGTPFDIFGRSEERRTERRLIARIRGGDRRDPRPASTPANHAHRGRARQPAASRSAASATSSWRNLAKAQARQAELLAAFRAPPAPHAIAAE